MQKDYKPENPFRTISFSHKPTGYEFEKHFEFEVETGKLYQITPVTTEIQCTVVPRREGDPTNGYLLDIPAGTVLGSAQLIAFEEPLWWQECREFFSNQSEEAQHQLERIRYCEWREFIGYLKTLCAEDSWKKVYFDWIYQEEDLPVSTELEQFSSAMRELGYEWAGSQWWTTDKGIVLRAFYPCEVATRLGCSIESVRRTVEPDRKVEKLVIVSVKDGELDAVDIDGGYFQSREKIVQLSEDRYAFLAPEMLYDHLAKDETFQLMECIKKGNLTEAETALQKLEDLGKPIVKIVKWFCDGKTWTKHQEYYASLVRALDHKRQWMEYPRRKYNNLWSEHMTLLFNEKDELVDDEGNVLK